VLGQPVHPSLKPHPAASPHPRYVYVGGALANTDAAARALAIPRPRFLGAALVAGRATITAAAAVAALVMASTLLLCAAAPASWTPQAPAASMSGGGSSLGQGCCDGAGNDDGAATAAAAVLALKAPPRTAPLRSGSRRAPPAAAAAAAAVAAAVALLALWLAAMLAATLLWGGVAHIAGRVMVDAQDTLSVMDPAINTLIYRATNGVINSTTMGFVVTIPGAAVRSRWGSLKRPHTAKGGRSSCAVGKASLPTGRPSCVEARPIGRRNIRARAPWTHRHGAASGVQDPALLASLRRLGTAPRFLPRKPPSKWPRPAPRNPAPSSKKRVPATSTSAPARAPSSASFLRARSLPTAPSAPATPAP
jgi:hypothetical protein